MSGGARKRVLVVGGTGYLGQHLLVSLARSGYYNLAFTHHRASPPPELLTAVGPTLSFPVDLRSVDGFDSLSHSFGQPNVIVNCAAVSVPRACETDPDGAMAVNVPKALVNWLSKFESGKCLLIHLSTDQVYEGTKSFYKEDDDIVPVNMYGRSKAEAEKLVSSKCANFSILRSSIIYGPEAVSPVPKSLPIQWIDSVLSSSREVDFFHDEFRCPVHVGDVVHVISSLVKKWASGGKPMKLLLNLGGPDRVSRVQMAECVAKIKGYDKSLIKAVSASSVDRGVVSPADISMDISRLIEVLGIKPVSFEDGVRLTLEHNGS